MKPQSNKSKRSSPKSTRLVDATSSFPAAKPPTPSKKQGKKISAQTGAASGFNQGTDMAHSCPQDPKAVSVAHDEVAYAKPASAQVGATSIMATSA